MRPPPYKVPQGGLLHPQGGQSPQSKAPHPQCYPRPQGGLHPQAEPRPQGSRTLHRSHSSQVPRSASILSQVPWNRQNRLGFVTGHEASQGSILPHGVVTIWQGRSCRSDTSARPQSGKINAVPPTPTFARSSSASISGTIPAWSRVPVSS
ncbi:hypothetical protein M885DRAFT_100375 [Pelagophyceae sp. CCMP2097]|nr:hypothetical protein M885DRAFT_100375 [Pelagophyceae sp. CCMP2097]